MFQKYFLTNISRCKYFKINNFVQAHCLKSYFDFLIVKLHSVSNSYIYWPVYSEISCTCSLKRV